MSLFQELGTHLENVKSWNPQQSSADEVFSYIDLSAVDKDKKTIDLNQIQQIASVNAPSRARQIVKKSDILVSTVRPNLNGVAFVPDALDKATASTGYCVLRANQRTLNAQYLFYWVQTKSFINEMVSKATGANYPAVSDKIIKQSKIPLLPLAEQQKIAAILDAADSLRQKDQQLVERYTALSQSLFLEMFGDLDILQSKPLKQLSKFIDYRGKTPVKTTSGIPLLTARNVKVGYISNEPREFISTTGYLNWMTRGFPNEGDILFTTEAPLGNAALLPKFEKVAIAQRLICIQPSAGINSYFLLYIFFSDFFKNQLFNRATGSTVKGIRSKELEKIQIPLPPIELQNQFAERIQLIEAQKQQAQRSLEKSEALFNSLLQRAFTGELTAKMVS